MQLLIVESPSKAKTIEKYLGGAFTVRASVGHVRDLPKSNKQAIDIDAGFVPHYENSPKKEHVIHELRTLAKKADSITLATDPDREGEAISWHIKQILDEDKKVKAPIQRVTFHEITKEAVEEALKNPRDIDNDLVSAQEARRVLDRLVGYTLSGLIWKKVRYGLSAGRVQSPALRIIMEREREIRAFVPETYWVIEADTITPKKATLTLLCSDEPRNKEIVETIVSKGHTGTWIVDDVKETEQKRSPRAPFTTSTLQQSASTRLGFSPSRTMQIAQKLYEAGHITYMRTDSTTLSKVATDSIHAFISKKYGSHTIEMRIYKTKSKNAQEAHEAIRPTHIEHESKGMNDEQHALYRLIWERTVASQMIDAKILRTKIIASIEHEKLPSFQINGSRLLSLGWLDVERGARGEDVELPEVKPGDTLTLVDIRSIEKKTEPPHRYTEAGLIKELESRGIGRPSTYASIMRTLEERGYVTKEGKTLFPTDTGDVVSTFLENNFAKYIGDTFTAKMEDELDDIASGTRDYIKTLSDFYTPFIQEVTSKNTLEKITTLGDAPKEFPCPLCEKEMIVKLGKNGKFLSCSDFPTCMGGRTFDGKVLEPPKEIGEICPLCGFDKKGNPKKPSGSGGGKLVLREGRFGMFISCSRYPKCKFIKEDEEERKKKLTGVACSVCKDGEMMERRGRFGIFYSCTNYPTCNNAIKAKPTGRLCPLCESLMMEGTKTIPERCSNNKCENHRPDKMYKK